MRLGKITDLQACPQLDLTIQGRMKPQNGFKEGGFSAPIRTNQSGAFTPVKLQLLYGEQLIPRVTDGGIFTAQYNGSTSGIGGQARFDARGAGDSPVRWHSPCGWLRRL